MTHQSRTVPTTRAPALITLGDARKLTRASFMGIRAEIAPNRLYVLGA